MNLQKRFSLEFVAEAEDTLLAQLHQYQQLHSPGLEDFFLHTLPLSVLCGHMLKVGHLDSVAQLLAAFPKKPLEETDKDSRSGTTTA
eukprot:g68503.t1